MDLNDKIEFRTIQRYIDFLQNAELKRQIEETNNIETTLETTLEEEIYKIGNVDLFCVALFSLRAINRKEYYKAKPEQKWYYTLYFKVYDYILHKAIILTKDNVQIVHRLDNVFEKNVIDMILSIGLKEVYALDNILNEPHYSKINMKTFHDRVEYVSSLNSDMHTYNCKWDALNQYLKYQKLTPDDLNRDNLLAVDISEKIHKVKSRLKNIMQWNKNSIAEDIMIFDRMVYNSLGEECVEFLKPFMAPCKDIELQDFIFIYASKEKIYISKFCMDTTLSMLYKFSIWGQYEQALQYFFNFTNLKKEMSNAQKKYNKLMTYKIADVLFIHGYLLPMEIKKIGNEKIRVPQIEIEKYATKNLARQLGDIDIMFYSAYSATVYIVEYKNYQMGINSKIVNADINKISREKIIEKVQKRKEYVEENKKEILTRFFNLPGDEIEKSEIKTFVLTTKPNYYFYNENGSQNVCEAFDWVEFKTKVEKKAF